MTFFNVDVDAGTISFKAARAFYSKESPRIAALVFESRAEVCLKEAGKHFQVTLKSKGRRATAAELDVLAGEYLNEILNQEYRFIVGQFDSAISNLIVTQALYCAHGGARCPESRAVEASRDFKADVERLMDAARAEIDANRPKRTSP